MKLTFAELLESFVRRTGQPVSRVASQAELPKQTVFNWLAGRTPRFHSGLPSDLERLSCALGLDKVGRDALLLAAGCLCAMDTPPFQEKVMTKFRMPTGWFSAGSHPKQYVMGIDPEVHHGECPAAVLASTARKINGFGTLMQACQPGAFVGKRVRFSALVRTADVDEWSGLWFRVDGTERGRSLAFDNMQDRPLRGTVDWNRHAVVLDVSPEADGLAFGVLLSGLGKVWIADVRMEEVALDVPSTDLNMSHPGPANLDFSE